MSNVIREPGNPPEIINLRGKGMGFHRILTLKTTIIYILIFFYPLSFYDYQSLNKG